MDILFFWHQPRYQSDLDTLLSGLVRENPALLAQKEAGMKCLWNRNPFDTEYTGGFPETALREKLKKAGK